MITVVVPVSPIKSHPDTAILDQTLASVRHWLPDSEIFVTFDGVRPEQESRRHDYELFIQKVLAEWDIVPFLFEEHEHQTGMLRAVIDDIRTPLMLYVEQDTPLVTDEPIDWDVIADFITSGDSNLVRLHHEALILEPHQHLYHGRESVFTRTSQWSQRPHVASVAYYRRIINDYFTPTAKSFIEDKMHSVAAESFVVDGMTGWYQHRLHLYTPDGNIKRSYHTDGRAGEAKYDSTQVF